jgi:hypothetical protein
MSPAHVTEEIFFGQGGLLRSGFGKQTLGRDPSAPSFGFGSSNRDAGLKLYASADHDKAKVRSSGGNQSQGAVYKVEVCTLHSRRRLPSLSLQVCLAAILVLKRAIFEDTFHCTEQVLVSLILSGCCCHLKDRTRKRFQSQYAASAEARVHTVHARDSANAQPGV